MEESLLMYYRMHESNSSLYKFHSHIEYEIYIFHEGKGTYLIHNKVYDLKPGDIILMDGLALHRANIADENNYIRSVMHFSPHWIKGMLTEINSLYLLEVFQELHHCFLRMGGTQDLLKIEYIFNEMQKICDKKSWDNLDETELKILLTEILIVLKRNVNNESFISESANQEKSNYAEQIAEYIQREFKQKLNIEIISANLNLSKSYLSHVFKEVTGFTVMEYVMKCRLQQAKYLLEVESELAIKDVAARSGFESAAHFTRFFKKETHLLPSSYRKLRLSER